MPGTQSNSFQHNTAQYLQNIRTFECLEITKETQVHIKDNSQITMAPISLVGLDEKKKRKKNYALL